MADSAAGAVDGSDAARQYYLDSWADSHGANVAQAWEVLGSGAEVDVAVLDTGMYSMADYRDGSLVQNDPENFHQEFDAGNLDMADARDFVHSGDDELLPLVNEYNPTGDDNGHGTMYRASLRLARPRGVRARWAMKARRRRSTPAITMSACKTTLRSVRSDSRITKVVVPSGVTGIESYAFKGTNVKTLSVKSAKLTTAKSVSKCLSGSKVTKVVASGMSAAKKKAVRNAFSKWCGKKIESA